MTDLEIAKEAISVAKRTYEFFTKETLELAKEIISIEERIKEAEATKREGTPILSPGIRDEVPPTREFLTLENKEHTPISSAVDPRPVVPGSTAPATPAFVVKSPTDDLPF